MIKKLRSLLIRSGNQPAFVPAGHFYSPIPLLKEVERDRDKIFKESLSLEGIEPNLVIQNRWLDRFKEIHDSFPYLNRTDSRYKLKNQTFATADAFSLYGFMQLLKPRRIIEVGSGMSSAVMMDVNEKFFDNQIELTFIEPFPVLLKEVLSAEDSSKNTILVSRIQDIPLEKFQELEANDILFIDSSHVSKYGSDVNYLYFQVLPRLRKGVFIHIHDINVHFEYPWEWIAEGRSWNEAYLVRSFLQFNQVFSIQYFNSYMAHYHRESVNKALPFMSSEENSGCSIWLKREV